MAADEECGGIFAVIWSAAQLPIGNDYEIAQLPGEHVSTDPFFVTTASDPLRRGFDLWQSTISSYAIDDA